MEDFACGVDWPASSVTGCGQANYVPASNGWHALCLISCMKIPSPSLARQLRQLCRLELETSPFRVALTERERQHGIQILRQRLPVSVLGHHDRMLQRGSTSIVVAEEGRCTACGQALSAGSLERMHQGCALELCDSCGSFLYLDSLRRPRQLRALSAAKKARLAVLLRGIAAPQDSPAGRAGAEGRRGS